MIVAHVFLAPYTLPVPFWLYLYGCAAALVLSFALLAYLAGSTLSPVSGRWSLVDERRKTEDQRPAWVWIAPALRAGALLALAITIAIGFWGPADPSLNLGMTIFWVWFLLAFAYLTAVVGDVYAWTNPWDTIATLLERAGLDMNRARVPYPRWLAYWPAVALYIALIWIELFALPRPATLAAALSIYTVAMLAGMYTVGRVPWLKYADVFGVFFRVVGALAPPWKEREADHMSLVVFILFILSSTTYDTIHETYMWISLYWQKLVPWLSPLWGSDVIAAQGMLTTGYVWYQRLGLVASPFVYLTVYLAVLWVALATTRANVRLSSLSGAFAYSLVPIAIAYHATHYFPSMLQQIRELGPQLADPLARGWRLLPFDRAPALPLPMSIVWHVQVGVLLAGHVAAVYLAHVTALRVFPTRGQSIGSQLPMLALMVAYTCLGLWALSLPLGVPQIVPDVR